MAAPVFRLTKVFAILFGVLLLGCSDNARTPVAPDGVAIVEHDSYANATSADLGRLVFFDKRLSLYGNQACAACHAPEFGFTGPVPGVNLRDGVYPGSVRSRFGNRRPPSAAYAAQSPVLPSAERCFGRVGRG